jgi:hypothetical protein
MHGRMRIAAGNGDPATFANHEMQVDCNPIIIIVEEV